MTRSEVGMLDKSKSKKVSRAKGQTQKIKTRESSVENKLKITQEFGLTKDDLLSLLRNMRLSRRVDDTEISMRKQSKAFFQISGAGHEAILTATAKVLKPSYDYFLPYYRDRALCLGLGVTAYEMLCQANGNIGDTSGGGRQMPAHWGNLNLNIVNKSSCTGTQFLQAVGLAEGGKYLEELKKDKLAKDVPSHGDEIVYVSSGDGTVSQGEFWESLTTACVNKLPVLYMIEDNGYAISVPVRVQTPRGSISEALANFPDLKIFTCDGNCPLDSLKTLTEAEKYLRAGKGPVLVHANVTRPYSHSLSDDHSMYRSEEELNEEKELDCLNSFPKFLLETGYATQEDIDSLYKEIDEEIQDSLDRALETPWPKKEDSLKHLYS
ncbi:MAG: thiamine pyrophosphate-dependent dehydrogenase E1 component subunit alpha, partial [Bacteriovoracaceae bacterium]